MPKPYYFCSFFNPLAATFWEALGSFIVSLYVCVAQPSAKDLQGIPTETFAAPHCVAASSLPDSVSSNSGPCLLSSVSLLCSAWILAHFAVVGKLSLGKKLGNWCHLVSFSSLRDCCLLLSLSHCLKIIVKFCPVLWLNGRFWWEGWFCTTNSIVSEFS